MPKQLLNLEVNDFSGGIASDYDALKHPPNKSVEERNFDITRDGGRKKRKGLSIIGRVLGTSAVYNDGRPKYFAQASLPKTIPTGSVDSTPDEIRLDVGVYNTGGSVHAIVKSPQFSSSYTISTFSREQALGETLSDYVENPFAIVNHRNIIGIMGAAANLVGTAVPLVTCFAYGAGILSQNPRVFFNTPVNMRYTTTSGVRDSLLDRKEAEPVTAVSLLGRMVVAFNSTANSAFGIGLSQVDDPSLDIGQRTGLLSNFQTKLDPASQDFVASAVDGTFIDMSDLPPIVEMSAYRKGLLIFTTKGIWYLASEGGSTAFNPYSFSLDKISETRIESGRSLVINDNVAYFWAESGLFGITPDENTGLPRLVNISKQLSIQRLYEGIRPENKEFVIGHLQAAEGKVRWLYSDSPSAASSDTAYFFDSELVLDTVKGAVTINKYGAGNWRILDYFPVRTSKATNTVGSVLVGGEVVFSGGEAVTLFQFDSFKVEESRAYTVGVVSDSAEVQEVYLATQSDNRPIDFTVDGLDVSGPPTPDPIPFDAFIKTPVFNMGDTQRKKGANYLTVTCNRVEKDFADGVLERNGSCMVTCYWDYANKWNPSNIWGPYEAYRLTRPRVLQVADVGELRYDRDIISTKLKLRGRGKAFQLEFHSPEGTDCELMGWGTNVEVLTRI